ncbi:hypothetical protein HK097_001486 [Rhizophlyctis rosea]|uniref:Uncharacterized protein n=1 Tax=Rhizophlyctis rosea TaxID=64517 RepID=A0AAD5X8M2_9FUNG|nr:hypothetical protein HK097_001486 [Rhizophlyctis rosea]
MPHSRDDTAQRVTPASSSSSQAPSRLIERLRKNSAISRSSGSIGDHRDGLSRSARSLANVKEADSVADLLGSTPKIIWTKDYRSEQDIMDVQLANDLPKSSELLHEVRVNGITFLLSNLQNVFDKFNRRIEQNTLVEKDIRRIVARYFADFSQWVAMYLKTCNEDVTDLDDAINLYRFTANVEQGANEIVKAILLWNTVYMRFLDFIRKREIVVGRFVDEFSAIEEENGILKDVLAQSGAGNMPIQIVMRSTTVGTAKVSKETAEKETNFPEVGTTPQDFDIVPPAEVFEGSTVNDGQPEVDLMKTQPAEAVSPAHTPLQPIPEKASIEPPETSHRGCQTEVVIVKTFIEMKHIGTDAYVAKNPPVDAELQTDLVHNQIDEYIKRIDVVETKLVEEEHQHTVAVRKLEVQIEDMKSVEEETQAKIQTLTQERNETEHRLTTLLRESQSTLITQLQVSSRYQTEAAESSKLVQQLQSDLATLQTSHKILEDHSKSQKKQLTATLTSLDTAKAENISVALELQGCKDELRKWEKLYGECKFELNATDIRLGESKQRVEVLEEDKRLLEKTAREAVEAERKLRADLSEIRQSVGNAKEEIDKLTMYNMDMERLVRMEREKNKEIEMSLRAIMRFPDVSLGRDLSLPDLPPSAEVDKILQEMINSNNVRIALLEQKNNEFRVLRLKQSALTPKASQKRGPIVQNAPLYDEKLLDKVKDSLLYQELVTHFGAGRGWEHMLPLSAEAPPPEPLGTYASWGPQQNGSQPTGRPKSATHHPPDELHRYKSAQAPQHRTTKETLAHGGTEQGKKGGTTTGKGLRTVHWKGSTGTLTSPAMKKAWQ